MEEDPETIARAAARIGEQRRGKYVLDRVLGIGGGRRSKSVAR